jgi:hypothetical protein
MGKDQTDQENGPGPARDPSSMFEILRDFQGDGFTADLFAEERGDIRCGSCDAVTPAGEIDVAELRRLEGASDPADMAAVVAGTCPACGSKGVMVVMYGPEASGADTDVLAALSTPAVPQERPGAEA